MGTSNRHFVLVCRPLLLALAIYENEPKSPTIFKRFLVCHTAIFCCSGIHFAESLSRAPLGSDKLVNATSSHLFACSFTNHMAHICSNGGKLGAIQKTPQIHTNSGSIDRADKPRALDHIHYPVNLDVACDCLGSPPCDLSSRGSN